MGHALEDVVHPVLVNLLPLRKEFLHLVAAAVLGKAAEILRNNGVALDLSPLAGVGLMHVGQRPDDYVLPVITPENGRHAFHLTAVEHVEHQRAHDVIHLVTERDFREPQLIRRGVENAAAKARAE